MREKKKYKTPATTLGEGTRLERKKVKFEGGNEYEYE